MRQQDVSTWTSVGDNDSKICVCVCVCGEIDRLGGLVVRVPGCRHERSRVSILGVAILSE
jgi:hypothetical protein